MSNFKLDYSIEFQQIRERRRKIKSIIGNNDFTTALAPTVVTLFKQFSTEKLPNDSRSELLTVRNEIFNKLVSPENIENISNEINNLVLKSHHNVCVISNYSFLEYLFWIECENAELKKYRQGTGNEEPNIKLARTIRRRAEETYKQSNITEAIKLFKEADEKYPGDFTVHYQLGLIYFFEKADFPIALEYFKKAIKHSQSKSKYVFICSSVLVGLLLRMCATYTQDSNLFSEAYQSVIQAYNTDPSNHLATYALIQASCFNPASKKETFNLLKDLIKKEKLFSIQVIYDRAFDSVIEEISLLYDSLLNENVEVIKQSFISIDEQVETLIKSSKFMSIPSKLTALKKEVEELKKIVEQTRFFDVLIVSEKVNVILKNLNEYAEEIKKNKVYFEIRDLVEVLAQKFKNEFKEVTKSFTSKEEKLEQLKIQLNDMNKTYPMAEPEKVIKKKDSDNEEIIPATLGWAKSRMFLMIKFLAGCFAFTFILAVIGVAFLFLREQFEQNMWVLIGLVVLNMLFTPLYASILAEIYYFYIENKRKSLQNSINRLEKEIELGKIKINEQDKNLREKYANMLSEQLKLSKFTATQMLDAGIEGNFEKIKTLIP